MFYVVHNNETGNLLDITNILPDAVHPEYSIKGFDREVPDLYFYKWDTLTLNFIKRDDVAREITVYQFLNKFTAIERIQIKEASKTNVALSDYMDMLSKAQLVNLDDPMIYGGLSYLVYLNLIDSIRIQQILE